MGHVGRVSTPAQLDTGVTARGENGDGFVTMSYIVQGRTTPCFYTFGERLRMGLSIVKRARETLTTAAVCLHTGD